MGIADLTAGSAVEGTYLSLKQGDPHHQGRQTLLQTQTERPLGYGGLHGLGYRGHGPPADAGDLVLVNGRVSEYQGRPQLEATKVTLAPPGSADPRDFLPSTYRDVDELKGFLRFHIDSVTTATSRPA